MHTQTTALRAYAVGARFSTRDVDDADNYRWRPTDRYWTDVEYRRPRSAAPLRSDNRPRRPRRTASPVSTRIDPSRIRTRDQQRAVARSL